MQHVFILLVAVPEANWQNDYSKINVKTKLFVNMYCVYFDSSIILEIVYYFRNLQAYQITLD